MEFWVKKRKSNFEVKMLGDWVTMKHVGFDHEGRIREITYRTAKEIIELEKIAERAGFFTEKVLWTK
jgi:hypothetical protein